MFPDPEEPLLEILDDLVHVLAGLGMRERVELTGLLACLDHLLGSGPADGIVCLERERKLLGVADLSQEMGQD